MPMFHPVLKKMYEDGIIPYDAYRKCYNGEMIITISLIIVVSILMTIGFLSIVIP